MMYGIMMGPNAVHDHEMPVTMRRFSLKYVFNASELADVQSPTPPPINEFVESEKSMIREFLTVQNREGQQECEEGVGKGRADEGAGHQQGAKDRHLSEGKSPKNRSIRQANERCRRLIHVDYLKRNFE